MKLTVFALLTVVMLSACDTRSAEKREADRIRACQEMLKTPAPVMPDHLTDKEKKIIKDKILQYEKCRKRIEDRFLEGEKERLPEYDKNIYAPLKLGGKFYIGPKKYSGTQGILIPHTWQYDYPAGEGRSTSPEIKAGDKGQVIFFIYSINSLDFKRIHKRFKKIMDYKVVCEQSKRNPELRGGFIWNDIFFGLSLVSPKQGKQEWNTICPEAVKVVSQFQEVPLNPPSISTKP